MGKRKKDEDEREEERHEERMKTVSEGFGRKRRD